jgi:Lipase (class 3)
VSLQWINNLKFDKVPFAGCTNCEVHEGFYEDYTSLSAQLTSALSSLGAKSASSMKLTGHSLGASEANLAAFELSLAGYPVGMIYNYGQPRVGNPDYAAGFDSLVVNNSDGVEVSSNGSRSLRAKGKKFAKGKGKKPSKPAAPVTPSTGKSSKLVTVHAVAPREQATLNAAFLATTDASKAPLSMVMVEAIERALKHAVNDAVVSEKASAAGVDKASLVSSIMAIVREHAIKSLDAIELKKTALKASKTIASSGDKTAKKTTSVKREADSVLERFPHSIDLATRHIRPAFSTHQMELLTSLCFPMAELTMPEEHVKSHEHATKLESGHYVMPHSHATALFSSLKATPAAPAGLASTGFTGAEVYRVTHNADIVPHVPPTIMGFQHGVSETWYDEAFDSYTECSTTNGEDPNCSDSVTLPVSVSDHLSYFNFPISNSC